MPSLRSLIKPLVPKRLFSAYRSYHISRAHRRARSLTPAEVFTDIYANNRWGGEQGTFCSGTGSSTSAIVQPYVDCISAQLATLGARTLTAVDLGCGDFSVGRQLAPQCAGYIGVDIVPALIEFNHQQFGTDRISFRCLNVIEDSLPGGDICFVRQVLQHLSNDQIRAILPKLARYRWTFITEHQPSAPRLKQTNLDKPHGGDIRVQQGSGVFLDRPPFDIPARRLQQILEVPGGPGAPQADTDPGVIRTFLLTA